MSLQAKCEYAFPLRDKFSKLPVVKLPGLKGVQFFIAVLLIVMAGCSGSSSESTDAVMNETDITDSPLQSDPSADAELVCTDLPPVGDGLGVDDSGTTCRIIVRDPSVAPPGDLSSITDVVLVTGQSNTLGSNTEVVEGLDDASDRVYAWTENGWDIADLRQVWDLGWHPRTTPDGLHPHNNFAIHFGKQVVESSDRVVAFIVLSAAGRPISHWDTDRNFYRKINFTVNEALSLLPHIDQVNAILWHQGENNWNGGQEYREKLNQLIANFRSEPWFGENALFICGETHRAPVNVDLDSLNNDADLRTACVSSLGVGVLPDLTHFSAAGLREIGRRYGQKYLAIFNGDVSSN